MKLFTESEYLLIAFFCGAMLASCQTQANELILHGPSYHFERKGYNEENYGLGYRFENVTVGFYQNSIDHTSVYLGYRLGLYKRLSVVLGAVTGYETLPVMPAAVLTYSQPILKGLNLHVNLIPFKEGLINVALGWEL